MNDPYRIPNCLSIGIVTGFFAWAMARGWPIGTIAVHGALAVAVTVAGVWLGIGGSVVKLTAAIVLWLPPLDALWFLGLTFAACVAAAIIAKRMGRTHYPFWPIAAGALLVLQQILASHYRSGNPSS